LAAATAEELGHGDLAHGMHRLSGSMRKRGLAVVISDFISPPGWHKPLRALSLRHETLCIELVDPRELELPDVGIVELLDPESGARREVNTRSRTVRDAYAAAAAEQRTQIARSIRDAGADHLVLRTDRDWLLDLVRFVSWRRERIDALARVRS
jgi:uncharacterized protein (DUF58 family)